MKKYTPPESVDYLDFCRNTSCGDCVFGRAGICSYAPAYLLGNKNCV